MPKKVKRDKKKMAAKLLKFFKGGYHWANGALAYDKPRVRDGDGREVEDLPPLHPDAKSWCLMGACDKLGLPQVWLKEEITTIRDPNSTYNFLDIPDFNDKDGWKPVRMLLARIAKTGTAEGYVYPKV